MYIYVYMYPPPPSDGVEDGFGHARTEPSGPESPTELSPHGALRSELTTSKASVIERVAAVKGCSKAVLDTTPCLPYSAGWLACLPEPILTC